MPKLTPEQQLVKDLASRFLENATPHLVAVIAASVAAGQVMEREVCAKIAENHMHECECGQYDAVCSCSDAEDIATEIRSRSSK